MARRIGEGRRVAATPRDGRRSSGRGRACCVERGRIFATTPQKAGASIWATRRPASDENTITRFSHEWTTSDAGTPPSCSRITAGSAAANPAGSVEGVRRPVLGDRRVGAPGGAAARPESRTVRATASQVAAIASTRARPGRRAHHDDDPLADRGAAVDRAAGGLRGRRVGDPRSRRPPQRQPASPAARLAAFGPSSRQTRGPSAVGSPGPARRRHRHHADGRRCRRPPTPGRTTRSRGCEPAFSCPTGNAARHEPAGATNEYGATGRRDPRRRARPWSRAGRGVVVPARSRSRPARQRPRTIAVAPRTGPPRACRWRRAGVGPRGPRAPCSCGCRRRRRGTISPSIASTGPRFGDVASRYQSPSSSASPGSEKTTPAALAVVQHLEPAELVRRGAHFFFAAFLDAFSGFSIFSLASAGASPSGNDGQAARAERAHAHVAARLGHRPQGDGAMAVLADVDAGGRWRSWTLPYRLLGGGGFWPEFTPAGGYGCQPARRGGAGNPSVGQPMWTMPTTALVARRARGSCRAAGLQQRASASASTTRSPARWPPASASGSRTRRRRSPRARCPRRGRRPASPTIAVGDRVSLPSPVAATRRAMVGRPDHDEPPGLRRVVVRRVHGEVEQLVDHGRRRSARAGNPSASGGRG